MKKEGFVAPVRPFAVSPEGTESVSPCEFAGTGQSCHRAPAGQPARENGNSCNKETRKEMKARGLGVVCMLGGRLVGFVPPFSRS